MSQLISMSLSNGIRASELGPKLAVAELKKRSDERLQVFQNMVRFERLELKTAQLMKRKLVVEGVHVNKIPAISASPIPIPKETAEVSPRTPMGLFQGTMMKQLEDDDDQKVKVKMKDRCVKLEDEDLLIKERQTGIDIKRMRVIDEKPNTFAGNRQVIDVICKVLESGSWGFSAENALAAINVKSQQAIVIGILRRLKDDNRAVKYFRWYERRTEWAHCPETHNSLLLVMVHGKDFDALEQILGKMSVAGFGPSVSSYIDMVLSWVRANKLREGFDVLLMMRTFNSVSTIGESTIYNNNLACSVVLRQENSFYRRCSCCNCRKNDDNKDHRLWLTCCSDAPYEGVSCGFSCHLECAFTVEKSGKTKEKKSERCCFYCVSCGITKSMLECWKKQITIAKETRRVCVLCYRFFLVQKLLKGLTEYPNLCEVIDEDVKCLDANVSPLTGLPMKMDRGNVNRLQSGPSDQKLCTYALETIKTSPEVAPLPSPPDFKMQLDTSTTGPTIISNWYHKVSENDYTEKSTCTLFNPNTRIVVSGLAPAFEYCFKVVSYSGTRELSIDEINVLTQNAEGANCSLTVERRESPLIKCSALSSTISSVEAEYNNDYISPNKPSKKDDNDSFSLDEKAAKRAKRTTESDITRIEKNVKRIALLEKEEEDVVPDKKGSVSRIGSETLVPNTTTDVVINRNNSDESLPITPFRSDEVKNRQAKIEIWVKDNSNNGDYSANGGLESGLGHCVKIFIETFTSDPTVLANRLIDTFNDRISIKRSAFGGEKMYRVLDNQLPVARKKLQFDKQLAMNNILKLVAEAEYYQFHLISSMQSYCCLMESSIISIRDPDGDCCLASLGPMKIVIKRMENRVITGKGFGGLTKLLELSLLDSKIEKYLNTHLEDKVSSKGNGIDKIAIPLALVMKKESRKDGRRKINESG